MIRNTLGKGFWRSEKPFVLRRKLTQKELTSWTRPVAHVLDLLSDAGSQLGVGAFPSKDAFTQAVATIGRQCYGKTNNRRHVRDYRTVARWYSRIILKEINGVFESFGPADRLNRETFDILLKSIPPSKRNAVWDAYSDVLIGLPNKDWLKPGVFTKLEDSLKSALPTTKPRCIVTMPLRMYVQAIHALAAQEIIYSCPSVSRWMIKHLDQAQVAEKLFAIPLPVVSQDISGFENALVPELRILENTLLPAVLEKMGHKYEASQLKRFMSETRHIKTPSSRFDVNVRCSGDFWTSLGNGLTNIALILTGHFVHSGRGMLNSWWAKAKKLLFVTEGDDAILPASLQNREVTRGLRMEFSLLSTATQFGGADFLKVAFYPVFDRSGKFAGRLGNTLRWARGLTFVYGENYRVSKRLFLLRAKAWSIHYLQPGHPIICALVWLIGKLTSGHRQFKGWQRKLDSWGVDWSVMDVEKPIPWVEPQPEMRAALATSRCPELPPVSIEDQLLFERACKTFDGDSIHIPNGWRQYPEFQAMLSSVKYLSSMPNYSDWTNRVAHDFFKLWS